MNKYNTIFRVYSRDNTASKSNLTGLEINKDYTLDFLK